MLLPLKIASVWLFFFHTDFKGVSQEDNSRGYRVAREHILHNVCIITFALLQLLSLFLLHFLKLCIFFPLQEGFQVLKSLGARNDLGGLGQGGDPPAALPPHRLHHTVHHCLHATKLVPHCHWNQCSVYKGLNEKVCPKQAQNLDLNWDPLGSIQTWGFRSWGRGRGSFFLLKDLRFLLLYCFTLLL